jgi:glycosyltransferase involved in cell wall biosynthesis
MTRLLWVTDEVPDRELGGGSIRQYHLLERIAERFEVDLLLVGHLRDGDLRARLGTVTELPAPDPHPGWQRWLLGRQGILPGSPPSEIASSRRLIALLQQHLGDHERYGLVNVEHEWLTPLLPRTRRNKWVITFHNLLSRRLMHLSAVKGGAGKLALQRESRVALRYERTAAAAYDRTIAVSESDRALLGDHVAVVPNGVDLDRFGASELPSGPALVFCGLFAWEANIDAAVWCCEEILPRVQREIPEAKIVLVGRAPDQRVTALTRLPGVEGHFDVPTVVPYLEAARVALVPLRVGSGTRLKALEAMAAGRPLAGTSIGLDGLGLEDGTSAVVADDADELARGIVRLCRDESFARRIADRALGRARQDFGWDAVAKSYLENIGEVLGGL